LAFTRVFRDAEGVEWEVYDDAAISIALALDWDHLPQGRDAGLVFTSSNDRRRYRPAPAGWQRLSDAELGELCRRAVSVR
jgi:hypothetical protein